MGHSSDPGLGKGNSKTSHSGIGRGRVSCMGPTPTAHRANGHIFGKKNSKAAKEEVEAHARKK